MAQERRIQAERDQLQAQLSLLKLQGEAVREFLFQDSGGDRAHGRRLMGVGGGAL